MNRITVSALALALTALSAGHAMAADTTKTRAQVEAERQEAIRSGDAQYVNAKTYREVFPGEYPAKAEVGGKTRAQVEAERQLAIRSGALDQYPAY